MAAAAADRQRPPPNAGAPPEDRRRRRVVRQDHDHRRRLHRARPAGAGSQREHLRRLALKLLRVRHGGATRPSRSRSTAPARWPLRRDAAAGRRGRHLDRQRAPPQPRHLDRTREEKGRMVEGSAPGGTAVLNRDDPRVMAMAAWRPARVVTYGFDPAADVRATEVRIDWPHGTRLALHVAGTRRTTCGSACSAGSWSTRSSPRSRWPGPRAAAGARRRRPGGAAAPAGPSAARAAAPGAWLIRDDFKSSLETIEAALDVMAELPGRRSSSSARCPSRRAARARSTAAGPAARPIASRVVVVGPMFQRYAAGATAAGMPRDALVDARATSAPPGRRCGRTSRRATSSWSRAATPSA